MRPAQAHTRQGPSTEREKERETWNPRPKQLATHKWYPLTIGKFVCVC